MASNKKNKNEAGIKGSTEDKAALLDIHDEVSMHEKRLPNIRAKIANGDKVLEYQKDPSRDQFREASEKTDTAGEPLMNGIYNKEKLSYDQLNFAEAGTNLQNKDIVECFTNENKQKVNSLNGRVELRNTSRQDVLNSVHLDTPRKKGNCPKSETGYLNDEEDEPLIVNKATSWTPPSSIAPTTNENTHLRREYAKTEMRDNSDRVNKETNEVKEDTSLLLSTETKTKDNVFHVNAVPEDDNENDSMLDERKNEDIPQQISPEDNATLRKFVAFDEHITSKTEEEDEKESTDRDSPLKEGETEPNGKATKFEEAEDETLTGEENTPLV